MYLAGEADKNTLSVLESPILPETATNYAALISRVLPYFGKLNEANKWRFLKRVYNLSKCSSCASFFWSEKLSSFIF